MQQQDVRMSVHTPDNSTRKESGYLSPASVRHGFTHFNEIVGQQQSSTSSLPQISRHKQQPSQVSNFNYDLSPSQRGGPYAITQILELPEINDFDEISSDPLLLNHKRNCCLVLVILVWMANVGLGIISLTVCYEDRKHYLPAYNYTFFFSGKWFSCLFVSAILLMLYCLVFYFCFGVSNLCRNSIGALPVIYIGLITVCYLVSVPIGTDIIMKQKVQMEELERSHHSYNEQNQLANTDAELFASQRYIENKEWRRGIYGIPPIMSAFMVSEMVLALVLLLNFCVFLFCVSGTAETNKQYNKEDIISDRELKLIEEEIKEAQKEQLSRSKGSFPQLALQSISVKSQGDEPRYKKSKFSPTDKQSGSFKFPIQLSNEQQQPQKTTEDEAMTVVEMRSTVGGERQKTVGNDNASFTLTPSHRLKLFKNRPRRETPSELSLGWQKAGISRAERSKKSHRLSQSKSLVLKQTESPPEDRKSKNI